MDKIKKLQQQLQEKEKLIASLRKQLLCKPDEVHLQQLEKNVNQINSKSINNFQLLQNLYWQSDLKGKLIHLCGDTASFLGIPTTLPAPEKLKLGNRIFANSTFISFKNNNPVPFSRRRIWIKLADKTEKLIEFNGSPLLNKNRISSFIGNAVDLTDFFRKEQKLLRQNQRWIHFLRAVPDYMFVIDKLGNVLDFFPDNYLNKKKKIVGTNIKDLNIPPNQLHNIFLTIQKTLQTAHKQHCEFSITEFGETRHYETRFTKLDEDKVFAIQRDVTDFNKTWEKVHVLSQAVEQSSDGIIIFNDEQEIIFANSAWENMHKMETSDVLNKKFCKFTEVNFKSQKVDKIIKTLKHNRKWKGEINHVCSDSTTFPVLHSISSLENSKGKHIGYMSIAKDITTIKESQIKSFKAKNAAQKANRIKSQFLANMSHEIRTPMSGIIGLTELALNTKLNKEQREYLNMVKASSDALLSILNNILDFSKIESTDFQLNDTTFNLRQSLTQSIIPLSYNANKKNIEISCKVEKDVGDFYQGDCGRLNQIITNLVGNSVKFSSKGKIQIEVAKVNTDNNKDIIEFRVIDQGIGISKEKIEDIFQPFAQADSHLNRQYEGTGLGLSISKKLAENMGGSISASSIPGKGSTFILNLPFKLVYIKRETAIPDKLKNLNILVVDDNIHSLQAARALLEKWGITVFTANNGFEALSILEQNINADNLIEVALLDCEMPAINGIDLIKDIKSKENLKDIATILMLPIGYKPDFLEHKRQYNIHFISKPFLPSKLFDLLLNIILKENKSSSTQKEVEKINNFQNSEILDILFAEDNKVNQELGFIMLNKMGHRVKVANNGLEAISRVKSNPELDLIFMDIQMPIMDGLEATKQILEYYEKQEKDPPIIIGLTANVMKKDKERCFEAGMKYFVSKPFKVLDIHRLIENIIDKNKGIIDLKGKSTLKTDALKKRFGQDKQLLKELVDIFAEDKNKYLQKIEEAIVNKDGETLQKYSHAIKGAISNFEAEKAQFLAQLLEKSGKHKTFKQGLPILNKFKNEIDAFMKEIRKYLR
ncbi:MAG: response regulator [Myxococcota bacterium]